MNIFLSLPVRTTRYKDVKIPWLTWTAEFIASEERKYIMTDTVTVFSFPADNMLCIFMYKSLLKCKKKAALVRLQILLNAVLQPDGWIIAAAAVYNSITALKPRFWLLDCLFLQALAVKVITNSTRLSMTGQHNRPHYRKEKPLFNISNAIRLWM